MAAVTLFCSCSCRSPQMPGALVKVNWVVLEEKWFHYRKGRQGRKNVQKYEEIPILLKKVGLLCGGNGGLRAAVLFLKWRKF